MSIHTRQKYEVGYSYPSSPNAVQYGYAKQGCYTVARVERKGTHYVAAFATKAEAEKDAAEREAVAA